MNLFEPHWVQLLGRTVTAVHRPGSVDAALDLLAQDPARRPVAGGSDLILELARTQGPPVELVDIGTIAGFGRIDVDAATDELVLGGGVRHNDIVASGQVIAGALPLAQACLEIGSPQLRNRATIAGNLVTASPANDTISALIALGADLVLARRRNGLTALRSIPVADFFVGFRETVLANDELIVEIRVPRLHLPDRGVWAKLGLRRAQAISVVHAGMVLFFDQAGGVVTEARVALGSIAATVVRNPAAEVALVGRRLDRDTAEAAAQAAAETIEPIDDGRASADYRRHGTRTVLGRMLRTLAEGRQAERWPPRVARLQTGESGQSATPGETAVTIGTAVDAVDDSTLVTVTVDGRPVVGARAASATLLDWLRDHAGTGTKEGCAEGECGACTVWIDGAAAMSCLVPAAQAQRANVTTIAGVGDGTDGRHPVQQALIDRFGVQCGYCTPGFVMAAAALVDEIPAPTRTEIEFGLAGNLCRCTGYYSIIDAVGQAGAGEVRKEVQP